MTLIWAIISILLGSAAQLFLKKGTENLNFSTQEIMEVILACVVNVHLWFGILCYGLSLIFWIYVLSKMELGRAYPLVSMGYVFTLFLGHFFLGEEITHMKIIGVILIIIGVLCLNGYK